MLKKINLKTVLFCVLIFCVFSAFGAANFLYFQAELDARFELLSSQLLVFEQEEVPLGSFEADREEFVRFIGEDSKELLAVYEKETQRYLVFGERYSYVGFLELNGFESIEDIVDLEQRIIER